MIKANSPYYISTPFVSPASGLTCTSYTLSIWVYDDLKATVPTEATYTITKDNATGSTDSDDINIARLISDFIEYEPQKATATSVINGNNNQWVKTSVVYTTDVVEAPQLESTSLMSLGYSYGNEGENVVGIVNDTLIPTQDYKVNRDSVFVVPILIDEAIAVDVQVISYPDNEINFSTILPATTDSSELVQYIWVQCDETTTDKYIEVTFNSQTTTLLLQDECKYTPLDIFFQNKEGAEQVLTFFKEQKSSITVTSSEFESDRGQPSTGQHQFVRYNVQAREGLTLNSGFVDEEMNEIFTQMLLSERIWSFENDTFTPLNIESKQLSYKTQLNERLINYEIRLKPSYNKINNI